MVAGRWLLFLLAAGAWAQPPAFEVASIQPSDPAQMRPLLEILPSGFFHLYAASHWSMLAFSFKEIRDEEYLLGAPDWLDQEHFDIRAEAPPGTSLDQARGMMRQLLQERFGFYYHFEQRQVTAFVLEVGKDGNKLKPSSGAEEQRCVPATEARQAAIITAPADTIRRVCTNTTMDELARDLPDWAPFFVDHPVVNLTALTGQFDFTIEWTPLRRQGIEENSPLIDTGGITIFGSLEKSLGLRLTPQKRLMPVVVIDHLQRYPADN